MHHQPVVLPHHIESSCPSHSPGMAALGWGIPSGRYRPMISTVTCTPITAKGCQTGGAYLDGTGGAGASLGGHCKLSRKAVRNRHGHTPKLVHPLYHSLMGPSPPPLFYHRAPHQSLSATESAVLPMPNPVPPTTTTHTQPRTEREDAMPQCNEAGGMPPPQLPVRARANLPRKVGTAREV